MRTIIKFIITGALFSIIAVEAHGQRINSCYPYEEPVSPGILTGFQDPLEISPISEGQMFSGGLDVVYDERGYFTETNMSSVRGIKPC